MTKGVTPRDELEQLWVEDVVHLVWEARRLRRLKDHLLKSSARHGLKEVLEPLVRDLSNTDPIVVLHGGVISAEVLIQNWYANDPQARS